MLNAHVKFCIKIFDDFQEVTVQQNVLPLGISEIQKITHSGGLQSPAAGAGISGIGGSLQLVLAPVVPIATINKYHYAYEISIVISIYHNISIKEETNNQIYGTNV